MMISYSAKHYTDFVMDITQTGDGYYSIVFHSVFPGKILDPSYFINLLHALLNRYKIHVEKLILLRYKAAFA